MLKKEQEHIVISISDDLTRLVHFKSSSKIATVFKWEIGDAAEEELVKTIQSTVNDLKLKKPGAFFVIPSSFATTKNIEIPSLDSQEINSIINLQAGRHTPYSREEILVGYINIGVYQKNYSKVLLIIVNRNVIMKHLNILQRAGLDVDKVLFAPEGMAHFYARSLKLKDEAMPVGLIGIGKQHTDFIVELRGSVITCRNISIGTTQLFAEGGSATDSFIIELKKTIESYQNEDIDKVPQTYIVVNELDKVKELQGILQDSLKAEVKIVSYLDHIEMDQEIRKLIVETGSEYFFDLVTPFIVVNESQIDLMPEEIKFQKAIVQKGKETMKAGAFSIILLILFCAIFFVKIHFRSTFLNNIKEQYEEKHVQVKMLEEEATRVRLVKDFLNNRMVGLEVIEELTNLIPEEIYLGSIFMDEKGKISIQGTSESMSRVFFLVTALETSELFKGVKTRSTTAKKERGKDVAAFDIVFKLTSAKDEEEMEDEEEPEESDEESNGSEK